ncbi:MAG: DNA mismatch repair protein MutS [Thermomicrobiales bacterium]|nr:DNA mismatch repair protein MutS [Thermomicrobiales bacterium]
MPASDKPDVVPLRRQYLQIKERFPDTILFFRLGDFYETFDGDAQIAADVLDIVLTGREMGKNLRVPMAGIPYHAAEGYIARLIAAGHKVAICEQIGEATKGKGLVERDVTRVVTPGTVVDPSMLDARVNNYIAAVVADGRRAGLAVADVTIGEFACTEIGAESPEEALLAVGRELLRLGPAELVQAAGEVDDAILPRSAWLPDGIARSKTEAWRWNQDRAGDALKRHFRVESLDGFGIGGKPLAIRAAGGLLQYLEETQLQGLQQINGLSSWSTEAFMTLDAQTRRNLELTASSRGEKKHSLTAVLDQTRTPMGARLLQKWIGGPLLDLDQLTERQDGVQALLDDPLRRADIRQRFGGIGDIERMVNRAITGNVTPRELGHLRDSLRALPGLDELAVGVPGVGAIPVNAGVRDLLEAALVEEPPVSAAKGNIFNPGFAPELDEHRRRANDAREWIANLERTERERTGIRTLKVGYNKVFGYYLEITTAALASAERDRATAGSSEPALPVEYLPKQSLANATRYFTPELKEFETVVLTAQETLDSIEQDIYARVVREVAGQATALLAAAQSIATLDLLAGLADVASARNYVRPTLDQSGVIDIRGGRHPTLEALLRAGEFVPNDARLDTESDQIIILTGPNMAGKSSWLRQTALIVLMAQIGSFVPAESARIGLVDRIFTRIGAQDDIATGNSTFMVEMVETATILNHATRRSLVVLDEIGRGTSTYDGLAIARAIVEHLHNAPKLGCKTLFATHYHELTELEEILPRVKAYRMDVLEEGDSVVFLRQVVRGGADRSYGVHVAQLAGIPPAIVRRAREILSELEAGGAGQERAHRRAQMRSTAASAPANIQMTLFGESNPALEALRSIDVESLSPLEAITKLFELQRMAKDS